MQKSSSESGLETPVAVPSSQQKLTLSPRRATMEDIAKECGVTKMTVSRVLAGSPSVRPGTRAKVEAAAHKLKYEVNTLARNLNLDRSGFVGLATPFDGMLGSAYFEDVCKGFWQVFSETDYDIALFDTTREVFNDGSKLAKLYRQRRVDGFLIVAQHTNDQFLGHLSQAGVPMVVVGEKPTAPGVCSVLCNDQGGIELACEHLYGLGHRRIAFIEGPRDYATAIRRKRAFQDFCLRRELPIPPAYIQRGDYLMRSGRAAGLTLLCMEPRPTAIIAANDLMAFGVIESARALGLRIPQDVSVTGFDDLASAADRYPSLTTIRQPVVEMGEASARLLLESLTTKQMAHGEVSLDVSLIVRDSTKAPARRSHATASV